MKLITHRGASYEYEEVDSGLKLFSVSQVRKVMLDSYVGIPESVLEPARMRGQILHTFFWKSLAAQAGLCEQPSILEAYEGRCRAILSWITKSQAYPIMLEEPSINRKLGIAGTPDAFVKYGPKQKLAIVDLKTGGPVATEAAQLLLYRSMEGYEGAKLLIDVYVGESGEYREIQRQQDVAAWAAALSAINLLRWRANQ